MSKSPTLWLLARKEHPAPESIGMLTNAELEETISGLYSEGHTQFGDLNLKFETFAERIMAIVHKHLGPSPADSSTITFVRGLHGRDLYLATACAQHGPGMTQDNNKISSAHEASIPWKVFEVTYKSYIHNLARFFHRSGFMADDLADNVLADLFLPDRSGLSRIASYDGRSSLNTWLRVIISNRSINAHRSNNDGSQGKELIADIPDQPALQKIDFAVRAARYGPALKDSLVIACKGLTPRERLILLWRYEHGLQLGQIARLLRIHQSNVTRQLERTQMKLRDEVITILAERHGLSRSAIQECLQDVVDNPSHNISLLNFIKRPEHMAGSDSPEEHG